ncbi:MAG: hypothetical protein AB1603_07635 [Chloroflexota bacterium]
MSKTSRMWWLRGCPSCGGDLYVDMYDPQDLKCLQCGRSYLKRTAEESVALREEVEVGRKARLPE